METPTGGIRPMPVMLSSLEPLVATLRGRCIVWCPVGIDVTGEVHALNAEAHAKE
jgi:hypothetical protein